MKGTILIAVILLAGLVLFGCMGTGEPSALTGAIVNTASNYCVNNSGTTSTMTLVNGSQIAVCTLPNGTQCEEWDFFYSGECSNSSITSANEEAANSSPISTTTEVASGCANSPYDGTWNGTISDSGEIQTMRPSANGPQITDNPFTAKYDFEITIQCDSFYGTGWEYNVTYVKASHPLFDCADGCTPVQTGDHNSDVQIYQNGTGSMYTGFTNGATLNGFSVPGDLQVSRDGKTITLSIDEPAGQVSWGIGEWFDQNSTEYNVETYNCQQQGGEGYCDIEYILPSTSTLTKVS